MLKILFLVIVFPLSIHSFGQKEDTGYKVVLKRLEKLYNNNHYDIIFYMFSPEMSKTLPLDKTRSFFLDIKKEAGNMLAYKFEGYESTYASYKTEYERRLLSMYISVDKIHKINGLYIQPYVAKDLPEIERNKTKLILPFKSIWTVMWGGDTKELNYHIEVPVQKNAFDFIITDSSGKSYKTDSKTNEDYYAFGKDIVAPCDGEIVLVVDGIKDNMPGTVNPMFITGNTVMLKTEKNEYLLFAHFKKHSIAVKDGQMVMQGQLLGLCGNSGNSSEPHLHFHIQNVEDINIASGAKSYFQRVRTNGVVKTDYSPVKGELIENVEK